MKLCAFLGLAGLLGIVFGLEFLFIPELALSQYGVPVAAHNLMQSRYFGSTLLAFGLVLWLARGTLDTTARRALLLAAGVGNAIGLVLSLQARFGGLQNALAWVSVGIYGALLAGSLVYLMRPGLRD
jgi:hypothetical protein